jgi:hypothetical protein
MHTRLGLRRPRIGRAGLVVLSVSLALAALLNVPVYSQESASRVEDSDAGFIYSGSWATVQEARASGGGFHQARTAGAILTYTFSGPYVTWVFARGPNRGIARVVIDGQIREDNLDLYAATEQFQQTATWGGMQGDVSHVLRIEVTGTRNGAATDSLVDVDALIVLGQVVVSGGTPLPAGTQLRFENNDPALTYGGDWTVQAEGRAGGGSLHQTRTENAFVRFMFSGSYVAWIHTRGPNRGIAHVTIDGGALKEEFVDLYAPTPQFGIVRLYEGLPSDVPHVIRIEATGTRSGAAADSLIDVDALVVTQARFTPQPTGTATVAATATPTATPTPQATATPRPVQQYPVDQRFRAYYDRYDGPRTLGRAISPVAFQDQHWVQYFEKARIEDRSGESPDPNWQFLYGLLVEELQAARADIPVGGDRSTISYRTIAQDADPARRVAAPPGFSGGVQRNPDGSVFVPYSANLQPGPGYNVAPAFWEYINRSDLFPGGWLHDVGLPITPPLQATVDKGPDTGRLITVQVFQRAVLTDDALNPPDWRIERANVGTDYMRAFPDRVPQ